MNTNPCADSTTAPHTFEQHPPEAGQLVDLIGLTSPIWTLVEHADSPHFWVDEFADSFMRQDATLLLPSPRQCKAAGLTAWDALCGACDYHADMYASWEVEGGCSLSLTCILTGRTSPIAVVLMGDMDDSNGEITTDPAVLETAANRMRALQAWLALWNEEATDAR